MRLLNQLFSVYVVHLDAVFFRSSHNCLALREVVIPCVLRDELFRGRTLVHIASEDICATDQLLVY